MVTTSERGLFTVLIALAATCAAVPTLSDATPKKVQTPAPAQINAAVQPLLLEMRKTLSTTFLRVESLKKRNGELDPILRKLQEQERTSMVSYQQSEEGLGSAIKAFYGTKVYSLTTSAILNLSTKLRDQVQAFRDQAINSSSAGFISGNPLLGRRRAMSQIVLSEKAYLAQVTALLKATSTWLTSLQSDLRNVSGQRDPQSLTFGFNHYLTSAQQRLDARRTQLIKASPFFNGKNPDGSTAEPKFECSSTSSSTFRSFTGDLAIVEQWSVAPRQHTSTDPNVVTWTRLMNEAAVIAYNGDAQTGQLGYIKSWSNCINSKTRNIQILTNDITRALQRGEQDLAKTFDLQRSQLEFEKTVLDAQLAVVTHRRDQFLSILNSVGAQATPDSLTAYPDAWRKTVAAHVKDLNEVAGTFPGLFAAAIALLDEAQTEMSALSSLQDWKEIQSRLALVAGNIEIIKKEGFDRLISQLESADESLGVMGAGIADGDILLTEALTIYEASTKAKVDFLSAENARSAERIATAKARADTASKTLTDARALMLTSASNTKVFKETSAELDGSLRLYYSTFGASRANPLYAGLVNELLTRASLKPPVARQKAVVEQQLKAIIASFPGISTTPEPGRSCDRKDPRCKAKQIKLVDPSAKILFRTQQQIARDIPNLIDTLSRAAAGLSLSELVSKIEATQNKLLSFK